MLSFEDYFQDVGKKDLQDFIQSCQKELLSVFQNDKWNGEQADEIWSEIKEIEKPTDFVRHFQEKNKDEILEIFEILSDRGKGRIDGLISTWKERQTKEILRTFIDNLSEYFQDNNMKKFYENKWKTIHEQIPLAQRFQVLTTNGLPPAQQGDKLKRVFTSDDEPERTDANGYIDVGKRIYWAAFRQAKENLGKGDTDAFILSNNEDGVKQKAERQHLIAIPIVIEKGNGEKELRGLITLQSDKEFNDKDEQFLNTVGKEAGVLAYVQSVQRELEQKTKELEEALEDKDLFMRTLTHDLKAPFTGIIGFLDLLDKDFDKYDNEKRKKFISLIYQKAKEAWNLQENILKYFKMSNIKPQYNEHNINNLVHEVIEEQSLSIKKKEIKINWPEWENNIIQKTDKDMFSTIVRNLLTNAIKFTPNKWTVAVEVQDSDKNFTLSIKNPWSEEEAKKLKKLYNDGNQTHQTTRWKSNEKGTGIWIGLITGFAQKLWWTISISYEKGQEGQEGNVIVSLSFLKDQPSSVDLS